MRCLGKRCGEGCECVGTCIRVRGRLEPDSLAEDVDRVLDHMPDVRGGRGAQVHREGTVAPDDDHATGHVAPDLVHLLDGAEAPADVVDAREGECRDNLERPEPLDDGDGLVERIGGLDLVTIGGHATDARVRVQHPVKDGRDGRVGLERVERTGGEMLLHLLLRLPVVGGRHDVAVVQNSFLFKGYYKKCF